MTCWMVTGGAGYIGSHVVRALLEAGYSPVVLDDLSHGLAERVPTGVPLIVARLQDHDAVSRAVRVHNVTGVVHLAALKAAGESVDEPLRYFRENVGGLTDLLEVMRLERLTNFVFSSSAAVYGTPTANPVSEEVPLLPENPYGETKVVGEWLARAFGEAYGCSWVALRYFNVAGAGDPHLGDNSVNNLIPMVFSALRRGESPQIFGTDYPTPDGTCIRDYIHVSDLAGAHVAAVRRCEQGSARHVYNVGRGEGSSVRQVMTTISEVIGRDISPTESGRRPGDPPATFADVSRIRRDFGWRAERDLKAMIESAWLASQGT